MRPFLPFFTDTHKRTNNEKKRKLFTNNKMPLSLNEGLKDRDLTHSCFMLVTEQQKINQSIDDWNEKQK